MEDNVSIKSKAKIKSELRLFRMYSMSEEAMEDAMSNPKPLREDVSQVKREPSSAVILKPRSSTIYFKGVELARRSSTKKVDDICILPNPKSMPIIHEVQESPARRKTEEGNLEEVKLSKQQEIKLVKQKSSTGKKTKKKSSSKPKGILYLCAFL